ncbi:MAG: class I SAM-dependent methyltransferase [Leptospirillum sp.]
MVPIFSPLKLWGTTHFITLFTGPVFGEYLTITNINRNKASEKIRIENAYIGSKHHLFKITDPTMQSGEHWSLKEITDWIKKNHSEKCEMVVKFDCEGCEYELFKDPENILAWKSLGMTEFVMEYHEGDISDLVNKFRESGYQVFRILKKSSDIGVIQGRLL